MKIYAELNPDDVCMSILRVPEAFQHINDRLIEIPEYDDSLLHKRYKDGTWEEVDPMYFYHPLSEQETASLQMQSDLEYLVCLKELGLQKGDDTMAYKTMKKLIEDKKYLLSTGVITQEEYQIFKTSALDKLDTFLSCNRLTDTAYAELVALIG